MLVMWKFKKKDLTQLDFDSEFEIIYRKQSHSKNGC